jgi:hypothetical protein
VDVTCCGHLQPALRGTYKVRVGGLLELLLGAATDVRIWTPSVTAVEVLKCWRGNLPAEKVPSNTWLISMIAGGCVRGQRVEEGYLDGERVKVPRWRLSVRGGRQKRRRLGSCGGRGVGREFERLTTREVLFSRRVVPHLGTTATPLKEGALFILREQATLRTIAYMFARWEEIRLLRASTVFSQLGRSVARRLFPVQLVELWEGTASAWQHTTLVRLDRAFLAPGFSTPATALRRSQRLAP